MLRFRRFVCFFFAASLLMAEDPYDARWAELRKRIAEGGDVAELLRQWEPRQPADTRKTSGASRAGSTPNPRMSPLLDPNRDRVRAAACEAGIHPSLALAIVDHETGFNNRARGEKGEIGAGQIMPSTADTFGFSKSRLAADYDYNIRSSVAILRYLLDYFDGDEQAAIRGYNGGPGWRSAGPATLGKIESYAASVTRLRSKYVPVTCG
jgi:soluble lytic murein transglycosylase-like protein